MLEANNPDIKSQIGSTNRTIIVSTAKEITPFSKLFLNILKPLPASDGATQYLYNIYRPSLPPWASNYIHIYIIYTAHDFISLLLPSHIASLTTSPNPSK